ncbi:MAG: copper amine oxidase N-terminal domain-containing protein [Defluviitaleaceae bacterium]|nr:copper amine oxidase N-terminal domain-containing protein [Defluviitaleaceae bacterium]
MRKKIFISLIMALFFTINVNAFAPEETPVPQEISVEDMEAMLIEHFGAEFMANHARSSATLRELFDLFSGDTADGLIFPYDFGGVFFDGNGNLVVLVLDDTPQTVLEILQAHNVEIQLATFSYRELLATIAMLNSRLMAGDFPIFDIANAFLVGVQMNRIVIELIEYNEENIAEFRQNFYDSPVLAFAQSAGRPMPLVALPPVAPVEPVPIIPPVPPVVETPTFPLLAQSAESNISVNVNGSNIVFTDVQPMIINDRTMVPLRGVFENMGFAIEWDSQTATAAISNDSTTILVRENVDFITVNDVQVFGDVQPFIYNGRFMLPLRLVAEATGAYVDWVADTNSVVILTNN